MTIIITAKILLPSLNQVYQETKPNEPCDGGDKMLGTPSPYRSVFGCAPPPTKLSRFGSLNPPTSVLWVCTPSILLFSDHSALRQTKSLRTPCSRTLPPVPLSVLMYFSFLECLASYRPLCSVSGFRTLLATVVLVTP